MLVPKSSHHGGQIYSFLSKLLRNLTKTQLHKRKCSHLNFYCFFIGIELLKAAYKHIFWRSLLASCRIQPSGNSNVLIFIQINTKFDQTSITKTKVFAFKILLFLYWKRTVKGHLETFFLELGAC